MWPPHLCGARRESGLHVGWRPCSEQHNFLVAACRTLAWGPANEYLLTSRGERLVVVARGVGIVSTMPWTWRSAGSQVCSVVGEPTPLSHQPRTDGSRGADVRIGGQNPRPVSAKNADTRTGYPPESRRMKGWARLPAPNVPGNTEAERMDNAVRKMFSISKAAYLKEEDRLKRARDRKRAKKPI